MFCAWFLAGNTLLADDWPQWLGPNRDSVWRESGIVEKFPTNGPPVRWRAKIGGGYAGPSVAKGRVYVADRRLAPGTSNPADPFAPRRGPRVRAGALPERSRRRGAVAIRIRMPLHHQLPGGAARDAAWSARAKSIPSAPRAISCCLDAAGGKLLWSHDFKKDFGIKAPMWGFAGHPLLDGNRLICLVGGAGSVVVAFDKDTGKEIWRALSAEEPGYCSPIIYEAGGKRQLILWHPEAANSLDPETGESLLVGALQIARRHDPRHTAQARRPALLHRFL